ncbi:hypothetical protein B0T14DRAFT_516998 [Immersiella caudata]|uniref:Uncharacterized protein n=1 Tax=Immersiella caudata TaxID=314043 RepID=A0AA39WY68_9PEZI|nr:hypothetical protein B0T14DRAFT_516998 [Immersiella caudata]
MHIGGTISRRSPLRRGTAWNQARSIVGWPALRGTLLELSRHGPMHRPRLASIASPPETKQPVPWQTVTYRSPQWSHENVRGRKKAEGRPILDKKGLDDLAKLHNGLGGDRDAACRYCKFVQASLPVSVSAAVAEAAAASGSRGSEPATPTLFAALKDAGQYCAPNARSRSTYHLPACLEETFATAVVAGSSIKSKHVRCTNAELLRRRCPWVGAGSPRQGQSPLAITPMQSTHLSTLH